MATLWRLPALWVYSAQLEWRLVSYTTTHAHPMVPTIQVQCFFIQKPTVCQLTHWAMVGSSPLSLVISRPVKLSDTDEHRGASHRVLYLQQWGWRGPWCAVAPGPEWADSFPRDRDIFITALWRSRCSLSIQLTAATVATVFFILAVFFQWFNIFLGQTKDRPCC